MTHRMIASFSTFIGFERTQVSHKERLASVVGCFVGIGFVLVTSMHFVGLVGAAIVVASIGSSAVLIFAVPHGALSQPWPVIGGHVISATIGVTIQQAIPDPVFAAATAVALATGAMYYLRCLHPPAGATALSAVIGGPGIISLGYGYVLFPVLLNVAVIIVVAIAFNYPFAWRRYPTSLVVHEPVPELETAVEQQEDQTESVSGISPEDLVFALSQIDAFIDVTESDLLRIFDLATAHAQLDEVQESHIHTDCCYSNGDYGENWAIREVTNTIDAPEAQDDIFEYRIVAGPNQGQTGVCNRAEFAVWARFQVHKLGNSWLPVSHPASETADSPTSTAKDL